MLGLSRIGDELLFRAKLISCNCFIQVAAMSPNATWTPDIYNNSYVEQCCQTSSAGAPRQRSHGTEPYLLMRIGCAAKAPRIAAMFCAARFMPLAARISCRLAILVVPTMQLATGD